MPNCSADFETRSDVDLRERGLGSYFASQQFKPLILCYSIDGEPVKTWTYATPSCPPDLRRHIESGGTISAHNATFERQCFDWLAARWGWPQPAFNQYRCSMATAAALGLPRSLDKLGAALSLPVVKDKRGATLINLFSKPRKTGGFNEPENHSKEFAEFIDYCRQDVATEMAASSRMIPLSADEQAVWELDQRINARGVEFDRRSAIAAINLVEKAKAALDAEMRAVTGNCVPACSQVAKLTKWCDLQGVRLEGVAKDDILEALDLIDLPDVVRSALLLRQEAAKSSTSKLKAFIKRAEADDRMRNLFVFCGTGPGRWASAGGVNLSNLPRPRAIYEDANLDTAQLFEAFRTEDPDCLRALYGDELGKPLHLVSDSIRGFIVAAPGRDLIAVDYSGIQGAIAAWLAKEEWKLRAMREINADPTLPDLYRRAAAGILNSTTEIVTKKHWGRQIGKVGELACFAADTYVLTLVGAKRIVDVEISDLLWDGVAWVKHRGLIERGVRPVVDVDGIEVTPSHLLLTGPRLWQAASELVSNREFLDRALAIGSANLPWSIPTSESKQSFSALAARRLTKSLLRTYEKARQRDAQCAPRRNAVKRAKRIGATMMSFLMKTIDTASSAELQPLCRGAHANPTRHGATTEGAGLRSGGEQIGAAFSNISSLCRVGINQILKWTGLITMATTRRETLNFQQQKKTGATSDILLRSKEKSTRSTSESPNLRRVYDIANAGPRNRFTIFSTSGFLIAHNCSFGGSVAAYVSMAKNYNLKRQAFHDLFPSVWAATSEDVREKSLKRYEACCKSRDKKKTDVLSREAWLACYAIVTGWRKTNPAIVALWATLENGARDALRNPGAAQAASEVTYLYARGALWCRLPSGRCVCYNAPKLKDQVWAKLRIEDGSWSEAEVCDRDEAEMLERRGAAKIQGPTSPKVTALGMDTTTQQMTRYALYGGLLCENNSMAIERDILVQGLRNCERAGYSVVAHNYDEIIAEVPRGFGDLAEMERLALDLPEIYWGIPLAAHGWRGKRNRK